MAIVVSLVSVLIAHSQEKRTELKSITVYPEQIILGSDDSYAQLIITGIRSDGRAVDLTHRAEFVVADGKSAKVSETGRVLPAANEAAELVATVGDQSIRAPLVVSHMGENLPIDFANHVVSVFTKLGCRSGGCHGKQSGQNGSRLSLLGFEPELDYLTLTKESRGRRLFPAASEQSLFLLKGTGTVPNGGGKKLEPSSDEYKIVNRWIGADMPYGTEKDPTVTKVSVFPESRVLDRITRQQFAAFDHYSDGTLEDITRRAQFESNDLEVATATRWKSASKTTLVRNSSTGWSTRRIRSSPWPWPTATGPTSSAAASSTRSTTCV